MLLLKGNNRTIVIIYVLQFRIGGGYLEEKNGGKFTRVLILQNKNIVRLCLANRSITKRVSEADNY